jgi:exonuclease III
MSNTSLRILQYNVNHGKDATLVPLLQDTRVHEFDILAIQEPWRNPFTTTSYNPQDTPFYLAYPLKPLSRVCAYINKRIHPNSWTVTHHTEDAQTVTIRYGPDKHQRTLQVHNIYNPSPSSYSSQDQGTLETLRNCLQEPADDHIVVGDFNLHHPLWSGLARPTQHAAADILLDIARNASLELVTKSGIETWRARGTYNTIDLSFISQDLGEKLIKCVTRPDITQLSDHILIKTSLDLQTQLFETDRKRC